MRGVTLKDVAYEANVSIMTVSRVINNKEYIAPETRRRVQEVLERLEYRPNMWARTLVTRRTEFLGMIVPDISNPFFGDLVKAVETVARNRGFFMLLGDTGGDLELEQEYTAAFRDRMCDAMVLVAPRSDDEFISRLNQDVPLVLVDRNIENPDVVRVALDNETGAFSAMKHLLELGHRRIGFIMGPEIVPNSHLRRKGYVAALEKFTVPLDSALIVQGEFNRETGMRAFHEMEALRQPPTAVFASNDLMAYGYVQEARQAGLRIPEDVSVVGFDDIFLSALMHPPLTTVRYPIVEMGAAAIDRLLNKIGSDLESESQNEHRQELKHQLIVRQSTCLPNPERVRPV